MPTRKDETPLVVALTTTARDEAALDVAGTEA